MRIALLFALYFAQGLPYGFRPSRCRSICARCWLTRTALSPGAVIAVTCAEHFLPVA